MSSVKHRKDKDCLNCGHLVEENFCSLCGQENLEVKEKSWSMITHAVADYFHFEHKFFSTLRPLLFKPGVLTQEYVSGKRASFIHPIRLYIFVSIVFFITVFSFNKDQYVSEKKTETHDKITVKNNDSLQVVKDSKAETDGIITDSSANVAWTQQKRISKELLEENIADTSYEAYSARIEKLPKSEQPSFIQKYYKKKKFQMKTPEGSKRFGENLLHNIPKMMFILLPLFAMTLHMLYFRKRKYFYEDLIYSIHVHSSLFIAITFFSLLDLLLHYFVDIRNYLNLILIVYIIWYIYRSLRVFYGSSRWRTVGNFILLSFVYLFLMVVSLIVVAAGTVMMQ